MTTQGIILKSPGIRKIFKVADVVKIVKSGGGRFICNLGINIVTGSRKNMKT
jgi:hypothetical protein